MTKSITFILPEELHLALKRKQAELFLEGSDGKKMTMATLVPKLLAEQLNISLPNGWKGETNKISPRKTENEER